MEPTIAVGGALWICFIALLTHIKRLSRPLAHFEIEEFKQFQDACRKQILK